MPQSELLLKLACIFLYYMVKYFKIIITEVQALHLQESGEMYLETIYVLSKKLGKVRSLDVAEYMGFSKPSVSRAVGLLKNGQYLNMDKDGFLTLTDEGLEIAQKIYERHTLLTSFLCKLGVDDETASQDACKMEHHISDVTFLAIKRYMEEK